MTKLTTMSRSISLTAAAAAVLALPRRLWWVECPLEDALRHRVAGAVRSGRGRAARTHHRPRPPDREHGAQRRLSVRHHAVGRHLPAPQIRRRRRSGRHRPERPVQRAGRQRPRRLLGGGALRAEGRAAPEASAPHRRRWPHLHHAQRRLRRRARARRRVHRLERWPRPRARRHLAGGRDDGPGSGRPRLGRNRRRHL